MENRFFLLIFVLIFGSKIFGQELKPFQIFNKNKKEVNYKNLIKECENADVVLFGELHNNSIIHYIQLKLTQDLGETNNLVLGLEMLETDNQKAIDEYLKDKINQKKLDSTARLWNNYKTDYKPLVDFAKSKNFPVIATNIPRRYASLVFKNGLEYLETLPNLDKEYIAPLPILFDINLKSYQEMLQMDMGKQRGENFPKAQAIKDATMAHFIVRNKKENSIFIHYNGSFHSDFYEGIYWYLKKLDSNLKIVTISTIEQKDVSKITDENAKKADFIIVTDELITKTY
jgi:uncharacterized iron-regulated protein